MNRELDVKIAKDVFKWKYTHVSADYDGKNECEILTEYGVLPEGIDLPPIGKIHEGYLVPQYSSDLRTALELAKHVGLNIPLRNLPLAPEKIAQLSYDFCKNQHNFFNKIKEKTIRIHPIGNRDLDAKIARDIYGWKYVDYEGNKVLTQNGEKPEGIKKRHRGCNLHQAYFVPNYSADIEKALGLAEYLKMDFVYFRKTLDPDELAQSCYNYYMDQKRSNDKITF